MKDPIGDPLPSEDVSYGGHDETYANLSKDERKEARIQDAESVRERERNELAQVLSNEAGQAFVMRMLKRCNVLKATFSSSHAAASFVDGQRDIGLWILNEMTNVDPEMYAHMVLAHVKRQRQLASAQTGAEMAR